ncbi:thiamine pyrophosphate-binding protein [Chloroflexota bacterium]
MKVGQIVGETLKLYDMEYVFGLAGGDHPLLMGLRDAGIKFVLAHTERSGVAMADGYSRITAKPSIAYGQWGPGAALCVSGLADAYWGQSPVICMTTSINSGGLYRYAYQGIEAQKSLFTPITKWNAYVPNIARLPDIFRTAIRMAVSGVPGPVHIDIPQELSRSIEQDLPDVQLYAEAEFMKSPACRIAPAIKDIEKIIEAIIQAKRPLILAGGGVIASEAWDELVRFAEILSIPVVTSSAGKASISTDHPLAVGGVGNYSRKVANDVAAKCDTYIVIGSNLGDHTTKSRQAPGPAAKLIHIDLNPGVLGTNYREEVSVVGDAKLTLKAMIEAVEASGISKKACPWAAWLKEVQSMVTSWKAALQEMGKNSGIEGAINPYCVMAALNKVISSDDVIVADTGYMAALSNTCIDVKTPGRKYIRASGSLGWGLPAALGAQYAIKDKARVICLTGDGGIGYHTADIETAVRCNLPVVVLVMNNSSLAFTYHMLKIGYKDPMPEATDFLDIDYGAVARAFGAYGEKVGTADDVEGAMRRALDSGKPAIIDFTIDKEIYAPVIFYEGFEQRQV